VLVKYTVCYDGRSETRSVWNSPEDVSFICTKQKSDAIDQTYNSRFFVSTSLVVDLLVPELSLSLL
jgi:hypothetical protein